MANKDGLHNKVTIQGHKSGVAETVDVINDGTNDRLAVDAKVSGVVASNLDAADDEVLVYGSSDGGTTRQAVHTDTAGDLQVDILTMPSQAAAGDVAHDAGDSGNPVKIGGKAAADAVTPPAAVATADRVNAFFDQNGRLVTVAVGAQAHDDANDADNRPVKVGGVAVAHGATPTEVAASDIVQLLANRQGMPFMIGGAPNTQTSQYISTGTITDDNMLPAISSGTKYVVTRITATVDEAVTVGVGFRIGFGATTIPAAPSTNADAVAGILLSHPGLVPGGGITLGDGSGILGVGGDGEELRVTVSDSPTGGSIHFTVTWYTVAS